MLSAAVEIGPLRINKELHCYTISNKLILFSLCKLLNASCNFGRLLISFSNSLDPDQHGQNIGLDLDPTI